MLRGCNFGLSDPLNVLKFAIISGQLLWHEYFHFNILTIVFERIAWAFTLASFLSVLLSSVTLVSRSWTVRPKLFVFLHWAWFWLLVWKIIFLIFVVFFFLRWFFLLLFRFTLNQTLLFTLITLLKEFIWRYWCIMFDWWWKRCCLSTYNVALNRLCRKITMLYLHLSCYFFVLKMKRNRVFKLLNQVLIYGLPAL